MNQKMNQKTPPPADKPNILIVDDQPENIRMLMEVLKDDYAVIPATSGDAALKKIDKIKDKTAAGTLPDLVLLDILMSGIDGYEVCRRLKADTDTRCIPVIFLTAISEAMDAARAFELGAVDYVTKPFNPVTVKARVHTHITLNRTLTELKSALAQVQTLSGLLPICSYCKKIRDDKGYWNQLEAYLSDHSDAKFSHGICPDCQKKYYPQLTLEDD
jgi:CheY-like chemotaxis protein